MPGAEFAARLRVGPDGSQVVIAAEMEQLKSTLTEAIRAGVPYSAHHKTGEPHIRDTVRGYLDPPVAGLWRLKFKANWRIRFLMKGTRAHEIKPRPRPGNGAPELQLTSGGGFVFRAQVHHPGSHRNPIVSRAIATVLPGSKQRLRARMGEVIAAELSAAATP